MERERIFSLIVNFLLIILGVRLFLELRRKKKEQRPCPDPDLTVDSTVGKYIPTQLVVWRKPGVSDADFNRWRAEKLKQYSGLLVKKLCENCDNSLELWEGDNVTTFISEGVASAGGKGQTAPISGGGDAVACYSYNLIIDLPEPSCCLPERYDKEERFQPPDIGGTPLVVAVFDTGLRPDVKAQCTAAVPSCLPEGGEGWNFAKKNNVTDDDHPSEHGSAVTRFIVDQAAKYRRQKINILPVKIHNKEGKSDLFSVLCGFAYAANCGAKIINASFGFYTLNGSRPPDILVQFVKKHLADKNILLIAAAGNVNTDATVGGTIENDVRNLAYHRFFPACLSTAFENVVAVTTICLEKFEVSPTQNFSNTVVAVGVDCDAEIQNDFRFQSPLTPSDYIVGSSYATPIVTGKIAQHYEALMNAMPGGKIQRVTLLQEMEKLGILQREDKLAGYITAGYWTKK